MTSPPVTGCPKRLLIVAGEVSGDIHAANMLRELRRITPAVEAFGVGGDSLADAGLDRLAASDELAHMGLVEVVRELPRIRGILHRVVDEAVRRRPQLAVLVDSPDFNLRLAARLRRLCVPVVLYVSPQLWAWRQGRVKTVRKLAREVLCILPFEVSFYQQHGVRSRYVGHPLVDDMQRDGLLGLEAERRIDRLALLPGSRAMEVRSLLPNMLRALRRLPARQIRQVVLIEAPGVTEDVEAVLGSEQPDPRLRRVTGRQRRRELAASTLAWTASGTATLECSLLGVPPIVGYRMQPLTYAMARLLVKVPHVALANLILGERAFPELIQRDWNPERLVETTRQMLGQDLEAVRRRLAEVRTRLGGPGASRRAAEAVAGILAA